MERRSPVGYTCPVAITIQPVEAISSGTVSRASIEDRRIAVRQILSHQFGLPPANSFVGHLCSACGRTDHGVPTLSTGQFISISYSGRWVAIAIADRALGIDLEVIKPLAGPIGHALAESEKESLQRHDRAKATSRFYRVWTTKEALLKAAGVGLLMNPAAIDCSHQIDHERGFAQLGGRSWTVRTVEVDLARNSNTKVALSVAIENVAAESTGMTAVGTLTSATVVDTADVVRIRVVGSWIEHTFAD